MTNGSGHHDVENGKKKRVVKRTKAEETKAKLKRKNLLPKAVAGEKK